MSESGAPRRSKVLDPYRLIAVVFVVGCLLAPFVYHDFDVRGFFLPWSRQTQGRNPSAVYDENLYPPCDYPPTVPYLLTAVERLRRLAGARKVGALSVFLLKLPGLLAYAACVPICGLGLRRVFGESHARSTALLSALCLPLFVNAALWGQFDALTSTLVVAAVVALLNRRWIWAGVLFGVAFSTKLVVIVSAPTLFVWAWKRHGARKTLAAVSAALLVVATMTAPFFLMGAAQPMIRTYSGAVGFYHLRTVEACNGWYLLDNFDIYVRGLSPNFARRDSRPAIGSLTFRDLGLAMLGVYVAFVVGALWRRPTPRVFVLATAMNHFAFFMLPTEVQGRYIAVAVPLLAVVAPFSLRLRGLFWGLCVTGTLGPGLELARQVMSSGLFPWLPFLPAHRELIPVFKGAASLVAVANLGLFAWASVLFWKEAVAVETAQGPSGSGGTKNNK